MDTDYCGFLELETTMHLVHWTIDTDITLIPVVSRFPKCRDGEVPPCFFVTHMLENKELLSLKQWHLKIRYRDRIVSFNVSKWNILLP